MLYVKNVKEDDEMSIHAKASVGKDNDKHLEATILSFMASLRDCANKKDLSTGTRLHAGIRNNGLLSRLGNPLVNMYCKCGALTKAQEVFDELPVRDVVSWTALIAGYAQHGRGKEAMDCFHKMHSQGFLPDPITYTCTLKACGIVKDVKTGKQIHDELISLGLLGKDVVLGTALVDMYARCGRLIQAQQLLDELPVRNVISWSALIAGYAQNGQGWEAFACYERMRGEGLSPNAITYVSILKACATTKEAERGMQIHEEIVSRGLFGRNTVLGNALVDMYAKCGVLTKAREVLMGLPVHDVVSWNALIAGYAKQGQTEEAVDCVNQMQGEGVSPDIISWTALISGYAQQGKDQEAMDCYEKMRSEGICANGITYTCILNACGMTKVVHVGRQIHGEIVRQGLLGKDFLLGNALVDMYAKCSVLPKARQVLEELPVRDTVSWNALIAGYAQQGEADDALDCFRRMQSEGLMPNIVSWSALIGGYAQRGRGKEALSCFHWMQCEGVSPDAITLCCVLNACSHSGLVTEGQILYDTMNMKYGITPDREHQVCMVDLFGRAGHFDKAMAVIKKMPSLDYEPVWSALLGACRRWGNVRLGRVAYDLAVRLNGHDAAAYVCMKNIYLAAGMQEDAQRIEATRVKNAAWKHQGGSSCVDFVDGDIHTFVVRYSKNAKRSRINLKLHDIALKLSQEGCCSHPNWGHKTFLMIQRCAL